MPKVSVHRRLDQLGTLMKQGFVELRATFKSEITSAINRVGGMVIEGFDGVDEQFRTMESHIDTRLDLVDTRFYQDDRDLGSANRRLDKAVYGAEFTGLDLRLTTLERKIGTK